MAGRDARAPRGKSRLSERRCNINYVRAVKIFIPAVKIVSGTRKIDLRAHRNHFHKRKIGSRDCKTHSGARGIGFGVCRVVIGMCKIDSGTFGDGVGEC